MGSTVVSAAVSAALAVQTAPTVPEVLKPSSNWNVEYAENMCLLTRDFGQDENKVTLGLRPGPASDSLRVVVITRGQTDDVKRGTAEVVLDDRQPAIGGYVVSPIKNKQMQIAVVDLKKSDFGSLDAAKTLHIKSKPINVRIAISQLNQAMTVLNACEQDLLASWGMDPAILASIAQFPRVNRSYGAAAFFSTNDYPEDALRRHEQGTTGARVHVAADGRVTACHVMESSGSVSIDSQTCNIIQSRFRFEPARTADGEAVPSYTYQRIRWEMPE